MITDKAKEVVGEQIDGTVSGVLSTGTMPPSTSALKERTDARNTTGQMEQECSESRSVLKVEENRSESAQLSRV